jgi:ATP-binding cassette, subfamily B, multidrug efflux pump
LQETFSAVDLIQANAWQRIFLTRCRQALYQALAAYNQSTVYAAIYGPLMTIVAAMSSALLLWAGAAGWLIATQISIGTLTAYLLLFQRFFTPITTLGDDWQTVQSALSGLERIFAILALSPEEQPSGVAVIRQEAAPPVEICHVYFGYHQDEPVLHDISLRLEVGEQVAIVGRTGAGKSSIMHLIGGLYTPWSGKVRVAGYDPRTLDAEARRRLIGVVPQTIHLFSGTIWENITLRDPTVLPAAVERAVALTGMASLIQALPQQYDTLVSGSGRGVGLTFSAGQQQLLAITRALLWSPALLLLDEATDAIDHASEAALRQALRTSMVEQGCAVLTVVHRLATAREADRVLVMEAGRVVEAGPPAELIRQGKRFAALVELEATGWDWQQSWEATSTDRLHKDGGR